MSMRHDSGERSRQTQLLDRRRSRLSWAMSPLLLWTQIAIVVFVVIGMIVAIVKLA
jgi:hypothetical protein